MFRQQHRIVLRIALICTWMITVLSFGTHQATTTVSRVRTSSQSRRWSDPSRLHLLHHHRQGDKPSIRYRSRSNSALWTTATATTTSTTAAEIESYDPFATANKIEPQTKPLPESMSFYAKYLIHYFFKTPKLGTKIRGQRRAMWKKLNEQRKNVMTLAGYTSSIVKPSFGFLFLGALMTSIVPNYWGKCIQCVATLTATKGQLLEAIIGLGVTSTLAALFTGIRGSLFWIGGQSSLVTSKQASGRMIVCACTMKQKHRRSV